MAQYFKCFSADSSERLEGKINKWLLRETKRETKIVDFKYSTLEYENDPDDEDEPGTSLLFTALVLCDGVEED